MAQVRLVASAYSRSNTNYVTVTNENNMYYNTDHTANYCSLRGRAGRSSNSTYYAFIHGFNFSAVPEDATVTSFKVKIRAYRNSYMATGNANYRIRLASQPSNSYAIGNTTLSSDITTTSGGTVYEIPIGSLTWDTLKSYGSNFSIDVPLRNSSTSSSNYPYVYVYGAEIEVNYTLPTAYNVTVTGDSSSVVPTGTSSVFEGDSFSLKAYYDSKPIVTDNNVDVSSQLVQEQESGGTYTVEQASGTNYGFALNNDGYYESNNKAVASSCALCIVRFSLPVAATITFSLINYAEATYDYGLFSNTDTTLSTNASADTTNVHWNGKNNNSASVQTTTYTMTAGEHYVYVKYFKDQYTDSNNDSLQFKVAITLDEPYTPRTYWRYTISSVNGDHTIIVSPASTNALYFKVNGAWVQATKAYKKVNGAWVEQSDLTAVFLAGTNYVKGD